MDTTRIEIRGLKLTNPSNLISGRDTNTKKFLKEKVRMSESLRCEKKGSRKKRTPKMY
jgi:hypothetical protein